TGFLARLMGSNRRTRTYGSSAARPRPSSRQRAHFMWAALSGEYSWQVPDCSRESTKAALFASRSDSAILPRRSLLFPRQAAAHFGCPQIIAGVRILWAYCRFAFLLPAKNGELFPAQSDVYVLCGPTLGHL